MIPKTIHYCWFGDGEMPENARKCIESWREKCPTYRIKKWDESSFDVMCNEYVKEAYRSEKWAFVSDYARLWIVYNEGGIYLDTDVELIKSLDECRQHEAFFGREQNGLINTGLGFGAVKGHYSVKYLLDAYNNARFLIDEDYMDMTPCPFRNTVALRRVGFSVHGGYQEIDGIVVYGKDTLCPYDYKSKKMRITDETIAIHWNAESWSATKYTRHKYRVLYQIFGHSIGHYMSEVVETAAERGVVIGVRFAIRRILIRINNHRLLRGFKDEKD